MCDSTHSYFNMPCAWLRFEPSSFCNAATQRTTVHHTAPHCTTLHHTAPHLTVLLHTATHCDLSPLRVASLQHTAPNCTTLHHTSSHCTMLHRTAPHRTVLLHTAPHCNTLQHIATQEVWQHLVQLLHDEQSCKPIRKRGMRGNVFLLKTDNGYPKDAKECTYIHIYDMYV